MTRFVTSDTGPFAIVPEWVLDSNLPDRAVRLYALLARYADESGLAYPSRSTLASRLRCSLDSVDRAMAQLVKIGALTIARRVQNTAGEVREGRRGPGWESTSSLYRLHRTVPAGLRLGSRTGDATGAAPERRQEPQGCGPNESHLNENHLNETRAPNEPLGFSAWYDLYPRKVGRGKALTAYRAACKLASEEELLLGLKAQVDELRSREARYIPHPATWLNGQRWLDETPAPTATSQQKRDQEYLEQFA